MKPRGTMYHLAQSPKDNRRCHRLLKDQDQEEPLRSWPMEMAERNGQLVGCLSAIPHQQAIIAGPWAVATKRPLITAIRLIEANEKVLWLAGVERYTSRLRPARLRHDGTQRTASNL
jgi:hypothetical protein